ncbi:MAG: rRNA pseudouridine synthase [Atopobiaceae bacterium]|nr:rRNA pseudouridine synthase [Atopobiaceae bacterium]
MTDERIVPMRLQRFLARAGVASRRGSENLMTAGRVTVNGRVTSELGSKVDPLVDVVAVDGVEVRLSDGYAYLVLNKPMGYLSTMRDPQGRPCVERLVPTKRFPGLFPVGRLDFDTTGLLLFTTNGDAAQRMLHPSMHVWKHYVALVRGVPTAEQLERLRRGVMLDDGPAQPAEAKLLHRSDPLALPVAPEGVPYGHAVVGLRIHEGKKHQVKRMLKAVGHDVVRLHRDEFGPIALGEVASGCWRELTAEERTAIEDLTDTKRSLGGSAGHDRRKS